MNMFGVALMGYGTEHFNPCHLKTEKRCILCVRYLHCGPQRACSSLVETKEQPDSFESNMHDTFQKDEKEISSRMEETLLRLLIVQLTMVG